jgi:hypothetical protein
MPIMAAECLSRQGLLLFQHRWDVGRSHGGSSGSGGPAGQASSHVCARPYAEDLGGAGPHWRKLLAGAAFGFHFLGRVLLFGSFWGNRRRGITFNVW